MTAPLLVFDMDGVLVDVSESYRETIAETVLFFTGRRPTRDEIQAYKNQGGFNNDWLLSQRLAADFGRQVEMPAVVEKFNELFFGREVDGRWTGLVSRERWTPRDGLLDRLAQRFRLAIFTGRPRVEADVTLRRFASGVEFTDIVCDEDVAAHKPAPDGLLLIAARHPGACLTYVGDTVDDARSARGADVPFIGVAPPSNPGQAQVSALLRAEGACAVLDDLNQIEGVLP